MNKICGHIGRLGFRAKIKGTFERDGIHHNHFEDLCCCKRRINGISYYNLPETLHELYISQDKNSTHFKENALLYTNRMKWSSVRAKNG